MCVYVCLCLSERESVFRTETTPDPLFSINVIYAPLPSPYSQDENVLVAILGQHRYRQKMPVSPKNLFNFSYNKNKYMLFASLVWCKIKVGHRTPNRFELQEWKLLYRFEVFRYFLNGKQIFRRLNAIFILRYSIWMMVRQRGPTKEQFKQINNYESLSQFTINKFLLACETKMSNL